MQDPQVKQALLAAAHIADGDAAALAMLLAL